MGERLENEETDNIKISGSRGSREMTFVIGKVCPLFNNRSIVKSKHFYFVIIFYFLFCRKNSAQR